MPMCSNRKGTRRNRRGPFLLALILGVLFLANNAWAQIYLPGPPPEQPSDYGKVILDSYSPAAGMHAVEFDHWQHRARFTCRLCHVDIGFAMEAKATGIQAATIRQGFHCGACHDGKRTFAGKTIFAACSDDRHDQRCVRCHSVGVPNARKEEYRTFTAKLPKAFYGVDWEGAEKSGLIKPVDFLEGVSVRRPPMQSREDFSIKAGYSWVNPIVFSHEKHSIWNGCELCHPEIFPTAKRGTGRYSMFANIEGRFCGACHGKVAFPLNNCRFCHPRAPTWVAQ